MEGRMCSCLSAQPNNFKELYSSLSTFQSKRCPRFPNRPRKTLAQHQDKDRRSVVVMTESWQVRSCRFESYLAQYYSRCGDALVVRPVTPWLINKLGIPKCYVSCAEEGGRAGEKQRQRLSEVCRAHEDGDGGDQRRRGEDREVGNGKEK